MPFLPPNQQRQSTEGKVRAINGYGCLSVRRSFMTPLFVVASIQTLMYISVHRFVIVRNPLSRAMTRRRVIAMIAAAWALAVVASAVSISGLTQVT